MEWLIDNWFVTLLVLAFFAYLIGRGRHSDDGEHAAHAGTGVSPKKHSHSGHGGHCH